MIAAGLTQLQSLIYAKIFYNPIYKRWERRSDLNRRESISQSLLFIRMVE